MRTKVTEKRITQPVTQQTGAAPSHGKRMRARCQSRNKGAPLAPFFTIFPQSDSLYSFLRRFTHIHTHTYTQTLDFFTFLFLIYFLIIYFTIYIYVYIYLRSRWFVVSRYVVYLVTFLVSFCFFPSYVVRIRWFFSRCFIFFVKQFFFFIIYSFWFKKKNKKIIYSLFLSCSFGL